MATAVINIDGDAFMAANELTDKALQAALHEARHIIEENWRGAWRSFLMQRQEAAQADEKLRFKVSVGVVLEPVGRNMIKVSATVAYGTKHSDETIGVTVSNQPELPLADRSEVNVPEIAAELVEEAAAYVREVRRASAALLQRKFKIGLVTADALLDVLETQGVVGPANGVEPREVL